MAPPCVVPGCDGLAKAALDVIVGALELARERLAADTGVERACVSELERGLGNASVDLLDRLGAVLCVLVGAFLEEPPEGAPAPAPLPSGRHTKKGEAEQ